MSNPIIAAKGTEQNPFLFQIDEYISLQRSIRSAEDCLIEAEMMRPDTNMLMLATSLRLAILNRWPYLYSGAHVAIDNRTTWERFIGAPNHP